jgi:hypothetical protein
VKARTARSGYDRIGIAIKPWLGKEVRRSLVYPNECVLVAGDAAEFVGTELLVTLYNGLAIYIGSYDSSMGTRFIFRLSRLSAPIIRLLYFS